MANHASSKKRIKRNEKRRIVNHARIGRIRTFIKKLNSAIEGADAKTAQSVLSQAQSEMYKGVRKGVLHKKTVARKMSRLVARVKAIS